MELFTLIIAYIGLLFFAYIGSKGQMVTPSVIFSVSYLCMLILAFIFRGFLGIHISVECTMVILFGGVAFVFADILCAYIHEVIVKQRIRYTVRAKQTIKTVDKPLIINNNYLNFLIIVGVLSLVIGIYIVNINAVGPFTQRMKIYKDLLIEGQIRYRWIVANIYRVMEAYVFVITYVLAYNFAEHNVKIVNNIRSIIIIILYMCFTMIGYGARQPSVEIIIFGSLVYLYYKTKNNPRETINIIIKKYIPLISLCTVAFYYTAQYVGRRKTMHTLFQYIVIYFCGGLYYLNNIIGTHTVTRYWGENSFSGVYEFLADKFGLFLAAANSYKKFDLYGNTVTIFGDWYLDFGFVGVIIMSFFVALFFSYFYYTNVISKNSHFYKLVYFKLLLVLVWAGYDDRVRTLISIRMVTVLLLAYFFYIILVQKKIKIRI